MPNFTIPSFFILFLTFLFIWTHNLRKRQEKHEAEKEAFWGKEERSLSVRKKEIPAELYFHPNISRFNFPALDLEPAAAEKYKTLEKQIRGSVSLPMLSLSNMSNTDLRLNFGTANQPVIAQAEENYEAFLSFLYEYAILMNEHEHADEAITALEEAIRLKSDICQHYFLLADLYQAQSSSESLQVLTALVQDMDSSSKQRILNYLAKLS